MEHTPTNESQAALIKISAEIRKLCHPRARESPRTSVLLATMKDGVHTRKCDGKPWMPARMMLY